jgi:hypothetical protein
MRVFVLAVIGLVLAACDQTTQTSSSTPSSSTATASNEQLPPIYEPLIDMHRVNPEKYRKDLAECRQQAAPQEAAARAARQQQAAGTGLSVAGAVASFIPVSTFRQAQTLGRLCAGGEHLPRAQEISAASRLRLLVLRPSYRRGTAMVPCLVGFSGERAVTADAGRKARSTR